jgi:hypothetical protein
MHWNAGIIVLAGALIACSPEPPPAHSPAPTAPTAVMPVQNAPSAPAARHAIAIRTVRCAELLSAAEDDRAAGSMFLLGYGASRLGVRTIDVDEVEELEMAALDYCAEHLDSPAVVGFLRALGKLRR